MQLCLEGYYDGCIFHRIVKDFMVQTGDPTGTGTGGESIYGKPFKNERHSRLNFRYRGIVATANSGAEDNASQFFITLAPCKWLHGKHTIFGKITGNTRYNLNDLANKETDDDDRPLYPPTILKTEVLLNPFPDIQPRKAAATAPADAKKRKKKKRKRSRNLALLSFNDEFDAGTGGQGSTLAKTTSKASSQKGKIKSAHELLAADPTLSTRATPQQDEDISQGATKANSKANSLPASLSAARPRHTASALPAAPASIASSSGNTSRAAADRGAGGGKDSVDAEIAMLKQQVYGQRAGSSDAKNASEKAKGSALDALSAGYKKRKRSSKKKRAEQTLSKLDLFLQQMRSAPKKRNAANASFGESPTEENDTMIQADGGDREDGDREENGDDNDESWMSHALEFKKRPQDFDPMSRDQELNDYTVYDPEVDRGPASDPLQVSRVRLAPKDDSRRGGSERDEGNTDPRRDRKKRRRDRRRGGRRSSSREKRSRRRRRGRRSSRSRS